MKATSTTTKTTTPAGSADKIHTLLTHLGFRKALLGDRWEHSFPGVATPLEVDCDAGAFLYEKIGIAVSSATTANFSQPENFVVFECVCRLLEKGYRPKDIELEPEWKLGHTDKSGRADIWIRTTGKGGKKDSLLIIECKTFGREFSAAWRDTLEDGAQLFSYFQQERGTKFLCLYASGVADGKVVSDCRLINVQDNPDYLKTLPKVRRGGYAAATSNKQLFAVWRDAYLCDFATQGLFEKDIAPYRPGKNKYSAADLRELDHDSMQRKYHEFATILRQHNVSGHENAFDKLVNLFLAKLVDEKRNAADLRFHWKGVAYDDAYALQDRLQRLYTTGMMDFLGETVTYIDEQDVKKAFRRFERDPDATKDAILEYFRQLKFYTNNDFAFLDVHNAHLFEENFAILLKIVRMLEDVRLLTDTPNQFLGDLFEGFLDRGVKQSEGQFFTPLPVVRFIVSSLPLQELVRDSGDPPRVIDYACGAGHFLNEYAQQIKPFLAAYAPDGARAHHGAIVGVEKEYRLSKVAKVAAFMYGEDDMRIVYADALARRDDLPEGSFDLLVANPPYSVKGFLETLSDEDRARYELSEDKPNANTFKGIEMYFVERAVQLLKPCGLAAIILPSSILSKSDDIYVRCRDIILRNFDIVAIVEFGSGTFGKTDTNTVTLFLRKKDAPPDFASHCANRADAWLAANHAGDEVFQDATALDRYCAKRGFDPAAYREFLSAGVEYLTQSSQSPQSGLSENTSRTLRTSREYTRAGSLLNHDAIRALRAAFDKKNAKQKWTAEERAAEELKFLRAEERERLRVFLLADSNPVPVLLVRMPDENKKAAKAFLGYEWSGRKESPGIKYIGAEDAKDGASRSDMEQDGDDDDALARNKGIESIRTPLFDNAHLANEEAEKLNSLIRRNFRGALGAIPESLRPFARTVPLVDLLDFDAVDFDLQIRTGAAAAVARVESKFPLVHLGDVVPYVTERVSFDSIAADSYVSTDNMLPQCGGVVPYDGTPDIESVIHYKPDDILVSNIRPYLRKTWLADREGGCSPDVLVFRVNDAKTVIPSFAAILLKQDAFFDYMMSGRKGMKMPRGDKQAIPSFPFPLPPLPVQRQVVEECATVDADCARAEKAIAAAKAKIADLFATASKKASEVCKLGDKSRFSLQIGRRVLATQVSSEYSIPVFSANVFEPFGMIDKPLKVFSDFSVDSVLWGIDGDWMVSFMPKERPFYPTDHCGVLRAKASDIIPRFLAHALEEAGRAAGFKRSYRASIDRVEALSVTLPPLAEQKKVVAAVKAQEAAIEAAKGTLAGAAARKATILAMFGIIQ